MLNHAKGRIWLNFFTPATIAAIYLSLQFLAELAIAFLLYITHSTNDIMMSKLIVLVTSQVSLTGIFILIIIPILKVKDIEFNPISYSSFFVFIIVFCLYWAALIPINLGFSFISNIFDSEVDLFRNVLPMFKNHNESLFSIIIWLIAGTLGVALVLEYLYRRTLIPLLEKRGMSPFFAVLTSSCAFALVNIPVNLGLQITFLRESNLVNIYLSRYDMVNSLFYSLNLFFTAFSLGLACGIVYILTRNILFSIMIHCFAGLPYYLLELFNDNGFFILLIGLLIIVMNIIGLFITFYMFYSLFSSSSRPNWITILQKKSLVDIKRGLVGFFIIFLGINFHIVVFLGLLAEHAPIVVTLFFHLIFLGFCIKYIRGDLMKDQLNTDSHEIEGSADVS
ncbi:MAG: type II CAAX prenyl endopeptidase Rce1 family protein [Candidatus Hodarchaeota archaeon]